MAKISPCFKKIFVFFNILFAIFGVVIFSLALFLHQFIKEVNGLYGVVTLYVAGSLIFAFAVLGAYGAYKESKCALIVFFSLMCLATVGMLRLAIPVAVNRVQILSIFEEYFQNQGALSHDLERVFNPIQEHFKCCGLNTGYQDWQGKVPDSCNCVDPDITDTCESIGTQRFWLEAESRRVWSMPCGPLILKYLDKILNVVLGWLFSLAAVAILASLMSLAMIIRITSPAVSQTPPFSLSYQPPKYCEVADY